MSNNSNEGLYFFLFFHFHYANLECEGGGGPQKKNICYFVLFFTHFFKYNHLHLHVLDYFFLLKFYLFLSKAFLFLKIKLMQKNEKIIKIS